MKTFFNICIWIYVYSVVMMALVFFAITMIPEIRMIYIDKAMLLLNRTLEIKKKSILLFFFTPVLNLCGAIYLLWFLKAPMEDIEKLAERMEKRK